MDLLDKQINAEDKKSELADKFACSTAVGDVHRDSLQLLNQQKSIEAAVCLLHNIVETACEHFSDQGALRFANYLDLYCAYLEMASNPGAELRSTLDRLSGANSAVVTQKLSHTGLLSFERFVRDSRLIELAAKSVSNDDIAEPVMPPPPIRCSANDQ